MLLDSVAIIWWEASCTVLDAEEDFHIITAQGKCEQCYEDKEFRTTTREFLLVLQGWIPELKRSTFISPVQCLKYNNKVIFIEYFPRTRHLLFYSFLPAWWGRFRYYHPYFTDESTHTPRVHYPVVFDYKMAGPGFTHRQAWLQSPHSHSHAMWPLKTHNACSVFSVSCHKDGTSGHFQKKERGEEVNSLLFTNWTPLI